MTINPFFFPCPLIYWKRFPHQKKSTIFFSLSFPWSLQRRFWKSGVCFLRVLFCRRSTVMLFLRLALPLFPCFPCVAIPRLVWPAPRVSCTAEPWECCTLLAVLKCRFFALSVYLFSLVYLQGYACHIFCIVCLHLDFPLCFHLYLFVYISISPSVSICFIHLIVV